MHQQHTAALSSLALQAVISSTVIRHALTSNLDACAAHVCVVAVPPWGHLAGRSVRCSSWRRGRGALGARRLCKAETIAVLQGYCRRCPTIIQYRACQGPRSWGLALAGASVAAADRRPGRGGAATTPSGRGLVRVKPLMRRGACPGCPVTRSRRCGVRRPDNLERRADVRGGLCCAVGAADLAEMSGDYFF